MTILKSTLMASALILGTASVSFAQDAMTDKAKSMATDKAKDMATDMAKDKAKEMAGDKANMVDPAMKAGEHMMDGHSAKDAVMKAGQSEAKSMMKGKVMGDEMLTEKGKMDGDDMMTAGKVMMEGGSAEDAAMAVAKENAKDAMMEKADGMMKDKMMSQGTIKTSAPTMTAPATVNIACPAGTTAQANGTCMITGDYQPRG
ncbi:hypothetical protein [Hellea balneolensis]|uniref:hypothetical protein n=1 Tax=Hellea balneolensis TaxID=287478 RepID=UPI000417876B|nr:hypothetical protein [Hellea balneolensis]